MKRTLCAISAGMLLVMQAPAQPPALPQTYSFTATSYMMGAMKLTVSRNGSKELIEMTSGSVNMRQLYDFQARRIYNVDLNVNRCTTQEYASAYAPVWHDPIGGAAEIVQGTGSLPTIRRENVNGIAARLVEAALEGAQGKYRYWLDEKFGFPVKQTVVIGGAPEKPLFEMRQISYAPPATTLFTAPAPCTRVAGVVNANGGSSETTADVTVQGESRLGGAATAQGESGRAGASAGKRAALAGGAVLLGKWDFTGKDGAGTQWSGTLTVEKLEPNSFDPTTHTNVCDLSIASANSGRGASGACLYDQRTKAFSFVGDAGPSQYSFTAVLSPDGKSLTQGRWVEGASGTWSATLKAGTQTKR